MGTLPRDPLDLTLPRDQPPLTRDTLQEAHTNLHQSDTDPVTVLTSTTDSTVLSAVASVAVASVATMTTGSKFGQSYGGSAGYGGSYDHDIHNFEVGHDEH